MSEDQTPKGTVEETPEAPKTETPPNPAPQDGTQEQPEVDYQEKFRHSSTENQRLMGVNKVLEERIKGLTDTSPPTDEECEKAYSTWELMSETEREMAKNQLHIRKRQDAAEVEKRMKQEASVWEDKLRDLAKTNPAIIGREEEFVRYCYDRDPNAASDVSILADAFAHKLAKEKAPEVPPPPGGLEPGTGGPRERETRQKKLTADEVKVIREKDPKRFQEMVRKGEINAADL